MTTSLPQRTPDDGRSRGAIGTRLNAALLDQMRNRVARGEDAEALLTEFDVRSVQHRRAYLAALDD